MILRRVVVRLVGATVVTLAVLSSSVGAAAAGSGDSAGRTSSVLPFATGAIGLELNLTKVSPAAAGPDDEVVVTGTVRNIGNTTVKNPRVSLWLRPEVLADRTAITDWLAKGTTDSEEERLPGEAALKPLAAGATASFRVEVPPGRTGLFTSSGFGPRAITLQARADGRRLAALRSTIVWAPTEVTTPTRLSVIVPITSATPSTHAGEPTAEVASSLLTNGRLNRILSAAHDPGMAWAIDPAILTAAERLSSTGIDRTPDDADLTDPNSGSPAPDNPSASANAAGSVKDISDEAAKAGAQNWLTRFKTERRDRDLFALPYADPDLAAVLKSSSGLPLIRDSDALGRAATEKVLGKPLPTTLAWPVDGQINGVVTRNLARLKRTAVILDGSTQAPAPKLDFTPTGRSTVRSSSESLTGLVFDPQLSTLLGSEAAQTPAATQTLLAELAAITMEQPDTARHLLAVLPRTWDPDPAAARTMMNALGSAPWISLRPISELEKASGPPRGTPVYRKAALKAELPRGTVSAAQVLNKGLTAFAPILLDPAPVEPLRERVASLLSASWRRDPNELVAARIDVAADVNTLVDGVQLGVDRKYRFTARKTKFPVSVRNETDYEIKVVVRLKPQSGQLTFTSTKTVEIGPRQTAQVLLEAVAKYSGDVVVEGKLLSTSGNALGPGKTFSVQVRPNWESRAMIVLGSILGILFVFGLLRSIRRNRNRPPVPIAAVPDVDELATRRAEAENSMATVGARAAPWAELSRALGPQPPARSGPPSGPSAVPPSAPSPASIPIPLPTPEMPKPEIPEPTDGDKAPISTARMMRSSAVMAGGTAASRILGFVRAALLVAVLDTGASADAFSVANTIPNALYILLAGGVLNAVLVPQITRAAKLADGGQEYIDRLLTAAVAILFVVTITVTLAAPLLIKVYASDEWTSKQFTLATAFALWCLPQIFFYGIYTMLGQVLNARGSFGPFMWAPVVNNVVGIAGLVAFMVVAGRGNQPLDSWTSGRIALLAGTATLGVVAQALILIPAMKHARIGFKIRWGLRGFGLRTASRVAGWTFAAVLVQQLGFIVISKVTTTGGQRSTQTDAAIGTGKAVYDQAFLLFMLPHSLVAVSLVTALFTRMSISAAENRIEDVRSDLSLGLRLTGLATVLSAAAFLAIGPDITATLFSGSPKPTTDGIAYVAMAMMVGLVPFSAQYLFQRVFYAFEDAKTPFLVQVPIVVIWAVGNLLSLALLPAEWVVVGVGASMTVANTTGAALSYYLLHRRFGELDGNRVLGTHLKMLAAAAIGGLSAFLIGHGVHALLGGERIASMVAALLGGVTLIALYALVLRRLKVTELDDALVPLLKRR